MKAGGKAQPRTRKKKRNERKYTSDFKLKQLVLQYLTEAGLTHSAFSFRAETKVDLPSDLPPGSLRIFVEKAQIMNKLEKECRETFVKENQIAILSGLRGSGKTRAGCRADVLASKRGIDLEGFVNERLGKCLERFEETGGFEEMGQGGEEEGREDGILEIEEPEKPIRAEPNVQNKKNIGREFGTQIENQQVKIQFEEAHAKENKSQKIPKEQLIKQDIGQIDILEIQNQNSQNNDPEENKRAFAEGIQRNNRNYVSQPPSKQASFLQKTDFEGRPNGEPSDGTSNESERARGGTFPGNVLDQIFIRNPSPKTKNTGNGIHTNNTPVQMTQISTTHHFTNSKDQRTNFTKVDEPAHPQEPREYSLRNNVQSRTADFRHVQQNRAVKDSPNRPDIEGNTRPTAQFQANDGSHVQQSSLQANQTSANNGHAINLEKTGLFKLAAIPKRSEAQGSMSPAYDPLNPVDEFQKPAKRNDQTRNTIVQMADGK